MSDSFHKFPTTPHLLILEGASVRNDKVYSTEECSKFLKQTLHIEEKVDGANLGISFDESMQLRLQNRGGYLDDFQGQWKLLPHWLSNRLDTLRSLLGTKFILFGEWCYAMHSINYSALPDWFLGIDVYDKTAKKFLSSQARDALLYPAKISMVPLLKVGTTTFAEMRLLLQQPSKLGAVALEGIYLRHDSNDWLNKRAKVVRPKFIQSQDEHWSQKMLIPNIILNQTWS